MRMKKIGFTLAIALILVVVTVFPVFAQPIQKQSAIPTVQLTPDFLAAVAGVILSLAFSYIPGLNTGYAGLDPTKKRLIMLALLFLAAWGIYGLGCGGILSAGITCDRQGAIQVIWMFVLAAIANQSTYQLSPLPSAVTAAKAPISVKTTRPS
jgi:hypothetical protein